MLLNTEISRLPTQEDVKLEQRPFPQTNKDNTVWLSFDAKPDKTFAMR
jgi:hypothetical protein